LDCLDIQFLTSEFRLAKEFQNQSRKGVFLYFDVFLPGNEFLEPKKSLTVMGSKLFSAKVDRGIKKYVILR
jgi:hypothetical protein